MVLVTGGTGFLGAYIIQELVNQGYAVKAIKRTNSNLPFFISPGILEKVEWVEGDILDVTSLDLAMEDVDMIIHAAGKVSFKQKDRDDMLKINVEGTANVVNTAIDRNIRRFIHISSVAALGRTLSGETITEKKEWLETNINTNYAISKYKAELEVWRGIAEGLNTVIVNPSTVLGYGDWNSSSSAIFKTVYNQIPWFTNGINGFVYVEDVARATVQLMKTDISAERFIVNGDNWSFRQLLEMMADGFQKKRPYRNASPQLAEFAWRIEKLKSFFTGRSTPLTKESARIAQTKTYFDNSKLLKALPGFQFTPLKEAILLSCSKYLKNL